MPSTDMKLICSDYGFIISKILWITLLSFLILAGKYEMMSINYYEQYNVTKKDLVEISTNDFLIILCFSINFIFLMISQLWKYINIYYYYASGIAQILSDVLNALIIIYSYSLYNYMILLIAFGIFILYLIHNSVQILFTCQKKKLEPFTIYDREQVMRVYPLAEDLV